MISLSALYQFPVKSMAGQSLPSARLDALGLAGDRRWMLVEPDTGKFITQRQVASMGLLSARLDQQNSLLLHDAQGQSLVIEQPNAQALERHVQVWGDTVAALDAGDESAQWLSVRVKRPCRLVFVDAPRARQVNLDYAQHGDRVGFADGFSLLLIGQASLDDLSQRVGREVSMLRFRPNLVVSGAQPYAEDQWRRIRIGQLEFTVAKPCTRCVIPTRDPHTLLAEADGEPLATLKTYRRSEQGIIFGQNLIHHGEGVLELGMPVEVLE
ncbi:MOSC domain-containing protein [Atopomonas sediminilitoris]|uniref:MOSC domain-containing protein n=1 Tax=Atopomonas sediminilitoris TaxID=2919919 RepID=UPI001F4D7F30|nr:MOSC domain-containing protein [Atopomonas sediminilitoris]MCJ8169004.1 MOSC domain-containing protein [Atopomonas sediminilitoris]